MIEAPIPQDEEERIKKLYSFGILDTHCEKHFDEITEIASLIFDCKIALVSIVDRSRQWFKSKAGLDISETPRNISFCGHAILDTKVLVVEDALKDQRFQDNPFVCEQPKIRFYAGAPLITSDGIKLGTLCIIDDKPKKISEEQIGLLEILAKQVMNYIELSFRKEKELQLNKEIQNLNIGLNAFAILAKTDTAGNITFVNEKFCEISGYSKSELIGQNHRIINSGFHSKEFFSQMWKEITDGNIWKGEIKNKRKDGSFYWVDTTIIPIKDINEKIIRFLSFRLDITHKKILENELRLKNEYLDLALEGAGLGVWDWNLLDNSVEFDRRWAQMLGYDLSEIEMSLKTWESRVHPEDLGKCYEDIKKYMNGDTVSYENIHRMKHKNGHWVYILDKGRFSAFDKDGKPIRFTGTHLDITETKKATDEKIEEFTQILSSTPSCLKIISKDGKLLNMNRQGLDLIEANDLASVYEANVYDLVEEGHRDKFIEMNKKVCSGSQETLVFEIIGLNGTRRWMETYAAPLKLPNGEIAQIAITNEITQKIKADEELKKQKQITEHQSKLASLGQLAAGVGHEINNPMAIIKGHAEFIKNYLAKGETDKIEKSLDKINNAIDRVTNIVKGLKTFARPDDFTFSKINFSKLLFENIELIKDLYKRDGILFELDIEDNIQIIGNSGRIQQVIINLFSNAKDAMKGKLKKISISLKKENKILKLRIKDSGSGISDEIVDRIFEPFFTSKDVNEGTGIGLSISHQILLEHNGTIAVEKTIKNEGTTFIIELPLYENQSILEDELEKPNRQEDIKNDSLNILIVDDEENLREVLELFLNELGHKVDHAKNGLDALQIYQQNPQKYDLVISDMQMPMMDGISLIKKIKEFNNDPPYCIIVTGGINSDFENNKDLITKFVDGFIAKPFDLNTIEQTISEVLKK